jgi:PHD/YefM family antitoxin component YafN of YafNO toxin-antitoxin module
VRNITANTARKDFDGLLDEVIQFGEPVSIATDEGAVIMVSQEEWDGMLETLYLQSIPGMTESILEAKATPIRECLDSVGWDIK